MYLLIHFLHYSFCMFSSHSLCARYVARTSNWRDHRAHQQQYNRCWVRWASTVAPASSPQFVCKGHTLDGEQHTGDSGRIWIFLRMEDVVRRYIYNYICSWNYICMHANVVSYMQIAWYSTIMINNSYMIPANYIIADLQEEETMIPSRQVTLALKMQEWRWIWGTTFLLGRLAHT